MFWLASIPNFGSDLWMNKNGMQVKFRFLIRKNGTDDK